MAAFTRILGVVLGMAALGVAGYAIYALSSTALSDTPVLAFWPDTGPEYVLTFEQPVSLNDLREYQLEYHAVSFLKLDYATALTLPQGADWNELVDEYTRYNTSLVENQRQLNAMTAASLGEFGPADLADPMLRAQVGSIIQHGRTAQTLERTALNSHEVYTAIVSAPRPEVQRLAAEVQGVRFSRARTFTPLPRAVVEAQAAYQDTYMPPLEGAEPLELSDYRQMYADYLEATQDLPTASTKEQQ